MAIFLVPSLFRVYPTNNAGITLGKIFEDKVRFDVAKTLLFPVPGITLEIQKLGITDGGGGA